MVEDVHHDVAEIDEHPTPVARAFAPTSMSTGSTAFFSSAATMAALAVARDSRRSRSSPGRNACRIGGASRTGLVGRFLATSLPLTAPLAVIFFLVAAWGLAAWGFAVLRCLTVGLEVFFFVT